MGRPAFLVLLILQLLVIVGCVFYNCTTEVSVLHAVNYGVISGMAGGVCYVATKLAFVVFGAPGIWSNGTFYAFWLVAVAFEVVNIFSLNTGMFKTQAMVNK
jgi:hypothetical protein